ncbi:ribokinase [Acididesulfobacillus acetoxydans]|uniref:Ribokinase n=1 Tax=Acididesulfobacillus acetoxydans TaxID=1561005 RepID=A0A8S0W9U9_9FIRM|nr:ribokinase [Acididesulfobacillus acetoxydans]CAA7602899.1 ribokinase [Acididesulfobacillus acetoxydans]CEJ05780.1 Ribokinase [Acididesulfobacillus acetoxydans]
MGSIAVIGSLNMDIVNRVERAPLPGETIQAVSTVYVPGGKGANQAVAAARAGARVEMIGAVGQDAFGEELLTNLSTSGVGTEGVLVEPGSATGIAFITVDALGENSIILSAGANGKLTPGKIAPNGRFALLPDWLILQNEIPYPTVAYALTYFAARGTYVIYNPAPACQLPEEDYRKISMLILNETEAAILTGSEVVSAEEISRAASILVDRGCREVIITLGARGLFYRGWEDQELFLEPFKVKVTDTTAAGDTFVGAYAAALAENMPIRDALRFASAAAALAVTQKGAQTSIPERVEIDRFLKR